MYSYADLNKYYGGGYILFEDKLHYIHAIRALMDHNLAGLHDERVKCEIYELDLKKDRVNEATGKAVAGARIDTFVPRPAYLDNKEIAIYVCMNHTRNHRYSRVVQSDRLSLSAGIHHRVLTKLGVERLPPAVTGERKWRGMYSMMDQWLRGPEYPPVGDVAKRLLKLQAVSAPIAADYALQLSQKYKRMLPVAYRSMCTIGSLDTRSNVIKLQERYSLHSAVLSKLEGVAKVETYA